MKGYRTFFVLLFLTFALPAALPAAFNARTPGIVDDVILEYEIGPLYIFQNDGKYGEEATEYNASDVGQQRNLILSRRISAEMAFSRRHRLIFLYAPFDLSTVVSLDRDIKFRGVEFKKGNLIRHRYLFDGYRASYLNRIVSRERIDLDLGGSIQVRNAQVSFQEINGEAFETESDIGMVFAFKTRLIYTPRAGGSWYMFESDAFSTFGLAGESVKGAIYDLRLVMGVPVAASADLLMGTRLLGGGAEVKNKNIDNWGNYGSATLTLRVSL